jgi:FMN phosphatase YigB (HAD superfamily)
LKKFKIKPEEALFIDDGKKNCQVAESIGIKSVIAKWARQTIAETKRLLKI